MTSKECKYFDFIVLVYVYTYVNVHDNVFACIHTFVSVYVSACALPLGLAILLDWNKKTHLDDHHTKNVKQHE